MLSVIIPAYNEASRINGIISDCSKYLTAKNLPHEIIVVDDGSSDRTSEAVQELSETFPNVRIVKLPQNQGKGAAVKEGMLVAKGNPRLFMDADGATSIQEIERLWPYLKNHDIVIGSRALSKSIKHPQPWYRQLLGRTGNKIIRLLFGLDLHDTQCGFKLFNSRAADRLFPKLTLNRFGFDIELLALANKYGFKIMEVPVAWEHKEYSTVKMFDYFDVLWSIFKVKIRMLLRLYK